jgi:hypothetical protein
MIRPSTIIWLFLVVAVGYAMFQVKYEVMAQEDTLARINKDIADAREQIRVTDAEWSYLTRPDRVKGLATRYLNLVPMSAAQILELSAIPERGATPPALATSRAPSSPAPHPAPRAKSPAETQAPILGPRLANIEKSAQP